MFPGTSDSDVGNDNPTYPKFLGEQEGFFASQGPSKDLAGHCIGELGLRMPLAPWHSAYVIAGMTVTAEGTVVPKITREQSYPWPTIPDVGLDL
jgi:hypothetical protein